MAEIVRDPSYSESNLIWIDLEMTGLQPEVNRIIELGAIITDSQLNILHEGPVIAIHQDKAIMDSMDEWNTKTHGNSGLTARVLESTIDEEQATDICIETFSRFVPAGKSPMCGSTIGQDRRFMARWMPRLEQFFHYRSIDVSSVKELVKRWKPEDVWVSCRATKHQAISDIEESIEELRHYRKLDMKI
ncbi:MAG: oligoribonuclease [Sutterellaceae bacterium]|nr:oligoribonuclease [Sutterellaceae bacterium]MDD7442739.1 oligoribonuclease [Sutterellaceae bacterium]MDY2867301.1 oligoribonuclease [Mesosutterella sp.]